LSARSRIVIAIGGNAIIKERQEGTIAQQFANTRDTVAGVVRLIERGHEVTLTHGNGPQVGNILIRVQAALGKAYSIPIGVAVAESQGEIGYMIAQVAATTCLTPSSWSERRRARPIFQSMVFGSSRMA